MPSIDVARVRNDRSAVIRRHLPIEMTVRMLLRPLHLHASIENVVRRPIAAMVSRVMLY